jgi:hypothetical protein
VALAEVEAQRQAGAPVERDEDGRAADRGRPAVALGRRRLDDQPVGLKVVHDR